MVHEGLAGMAPAELAGALSFDRAYRARQVYAWIARGVLEWERMSDLSAYERLRLAKLHPRIAGSELETELADPDGSLKLGLRLADGAAVECVLLEDIEGRKTACLSSQVGCAMGCAFCKTGTLGFLRDLSAAEIMEQFHFLRQRGGRISNVVFMGMGEPLANLGAVRKAVSLLSDPAGIGLSSRRISLSTCGLVPGILDLAQHGPKLRLAVSLTSADDELRGRLMPVNRSWNLAALKQALLDYQKITGERITIEIPLLSGVNTGAEDARSMLQWLHPLKAQINVIPWNEVEGLPFRSPSAREIADFGAALEQGAATRGDVVVTRRMSRGRGVMGACGQLGDTLRRAAVDPGSPASASRD